MSFGKSPRKNFASSRRYPYAVSPTKPANGDEYKYFHPKYETLALSNAPFPSPDPELAREDPYHHYLLRSGGNKGKTLARVAAEDQKNDGDYCDWMKKKHYDALPRDHILRKALDQWSEYEESDEPREWILPALSSAPEKFKNGNRNKWMSERFLGKFGVTKAEMEAAGVKDFVSVEKTGHKKFAMYQVYEYAKAKGRLTTDQADQVADELMNKMETNWKQYKNYQSGAYRGRHYESFFQCCDQC